MHQKLIIIHFVSHGVARKFPWRGLKNVLKRILRFSQFSPTYFRFLGGGLKPPIPVYTPVSVSFTSIAVDSHSQMHPLVHWQVDST